MDSKRPKYAKRSRKPKLSRKQLYGIGVATIIIVSLLAVYAFFSQSNDGFKAAIVDQLGSREGFRNQTLVKTLNNTLTATGYATTYYKGSDVTVDFYRYLPAHGFKIIIMRVHSALRWHEETHEFTDPLDFFTSELYTKDKYQYDQMQPERLDIAMYYAGAEEKYFGILPNFVAHSMRGNFQDAVIILMGCNGLDKKQRSRTMLQALIGKGAKACIGWDDAVSVDHTDRATPILLHYLLIENRTIKDAINETMKEVGPDPNFKSELKYYPSKFFLTTEDVGNYTIPHPPKSVTAQFTGDYVFSFNVMGVFVWSLQQPRNKLRIIGKFRQPLSSVFHSVSKR